MSRRSAARKREVMPDPLFHSKVVAKLINCVMSDGKKSTAERIVYGALSRIAGRERDEEAGSGEESSAGGAAAALLGENGKKNALEALKKALDNVSPKVEVKSRRVGGSTYQVPVEVRADRRDAVGMRLLVTFAAKRGEKTMGERLANEIRDAVQNRGGAVKKCEDIHKMAEANKAFAHYRW
ncbi:MAG: 30S ribosomal protein S7 [Gammaproteobacteria bacterium]|nr:30S ribosomal protein S7 [Gammaproteobacteria bacterium]